MKQFILNYVFFLAVIFFNIPIALAQTFIQKLERYTVNEGLSHAAVKAILQDRYGYLWIGTEWGLNRYDGRTFKQYNKIGSNGLPDLYIKSLAEDARGNIWIGTATAVSCYNPIKNTYENYFGSEKSVFADKEKNIWTAGDSLRFFDKHTKKFVCYALSLYGKDARANRFVSSALEDSKGRFWVGTSYGVKLVDKKNRTYKNYSLPETGNISRSENIVTQIFEDGNGTIWIGTWGGGILRYNEQRDYFENLLLTAQKDDGNNVVHDLKELTINGKNFFIAGTEAGLVVFNPAQIKNNRIQVDKWLIPHNQPNELLSFTTRQLLIDRQQNCWVATNKGLYKIDPLQQSAEWLNFPVQDTYAEMVFHVIKDIKEPNRYVYLTTNKGWAKMDLQNRSIVKHPLPLKSSQLLNPINRYIATDTGYWFTSQRGFGFYNPYLNVVTDYTGLIRANADNRTRTASLQRDAGGRIWIDVVKNGLLIFDPATKKIIKRFTGSAGNSLLGQNIYGLKFSGDGYMWLSVQEKLYRIKPDDYSFRTFQNYISQKEVWQNKFLNEPTLHIDKKGRLLLISDQTICEFRNEKLYQLYPASGLSGSLINRFSEDSHGNFWILTNDELYRVSPDFRQWNAFSGKIGLSRMDEVWEIYNNNGDYLLTSHGRVLHFRLKDLQNSTYCPDPVLAGITTNNTYYPLPSFQQSSLQVPYGKSIEFEVSPLNFSNEKNNKIFYRLADLDSSWKELTASFIRYEQLPEGSYHFQTKTQNSDGLQSNLVQYAFTVIPPFYKRWWFYLAIAATIALLTFLFLRTYLRNKLNQQRLLLEKKQAVETERLRISAELHDDVGGELSAIRLLSEMAQMKNTTDAQQQFSKISNSSAELVQKMNEIVWALNVNNDTLQSLIAYIRRFAVKYLDDVGIDCRFEQPSEIPAWFVDGTTRRNIFLLVKEGLNNIVKHAKATAVTIRLVIKEDLFISLQDNGKGISEEVMMRGAGNGIRNMKQRIKELNGHLEVKNHQGTTLCFRLPLFKNDTKV